MSFCTVYRMNGSVSKADSICAETNGFVQFVKGKLLKMRRVEYWYHYERQMAERTIK
jgi:hypothetical protein